MNLCNIGTVRELLSKYSLAPRKGFGQNFLINPDVPARIAGSSAVGGDCGWGGADRYAPDGVNALEIGPGIGAMTKELSNLYEKVVAVEIDNGLIPLLSETLAECDNVTVVNNDFMKLSLKELLREHFGESDVHVCANLPYYITTPILMAIIEAFRPTERSQIRQVTVLVQSEVADRLCAEAGSENYGAITASLSLAGKAERLFTVPAGNFYPAPKVTSAVVQIKLHERGARDVIPYLPQDDEKADQFVANVKKMIESAFIARRKTLTNALSGMFEKEKLTAALTALEIRPDVRGEKLSAADFAALYNALTSNSGTENV